MCGLEHIKRLSMVIMDLPFPPLSYPRATPTYNVGVSGCAVLKGLVEEDSSLGRLTAHLNKQDR